MNIIERARQMPILSTLLSTGRAKTPKNATRPCDIRTIPQAPTELSFLPIEDKVIGNRYLIGDQMGLGGMGKVYEGKDLLDNSQVIIKEIIIPNRPDLIQHESMVAYWAAYGPNVSPNLARFHGLFHGTTGKAYQVYEYVPGETIKSLLDAGKPFPINEALAIVEQIGKALLYCREQGIVHGDIKPDNIIYNQETGKATVIDLGISVASDEKALIGTPAFASPEQLQKKAIDERADIFALGVTFYDLITGTALSSNKAILQRNWKLRIKSFPDNIPDQLADLIIQMTKPNKQNRPQNLEMVLDSIMALRQSHPFSSTTSPAPS